MKGVYSVTVNDIPEQSVTSSNAISSHLCKEPFKINYEPDAQISVTKAMTKNDLHIQL